MLKIYRISEVADLIGATPNTIWRWAKAGTFPAPIRIGSNSVGWRSDHLQDWIESRPAYKANPHVITKRSA